MASTADPSRIEAAAQRLKAALAALEVAVGRRLEADRGHAVAARQLQAMQSDRQRLAEELDRASERIATLESANSDVARRIDVTMNAIRGVLARYEA